MRAAATIATEGHLLKPSVDWRPSLVGGAIAGAIPTPQLKSDASRVRQPYEAGSVSKRSWRVSSS